MQDQNVLALDIEKSDEKNIKSSTDHSFDAAPENDSKDSKFVEKNQKIYSENDSKKFEDILLRHIQKMNETTITRNQLLTQHRQTLLQLFGLGATVQEILTFSRRKQFYWNYCRKFNSFFKEEKINYGVKFLGTVDIFCAKK